MFVFLGFFWGGCYLSLVSYWNLVEIFSNIDQELQWNSNSRTADWQLHHKVYYDSFIVYIVLQTPLKKYCFGYQWDIPVYWHKYPQISCLLSLPIIINNNIIVFKNKKWNRICLCFQSFQRCSQFPPLSYPSL